MLAVAEAIAAIAQTPGKGAALSPWKIVKSSLFETDMFETKLDCFTIRISYCNKLSLQLDCNLLQLHFLLQFDFFFRI